MGNFQLLGFRAIVLVLILSFVGLPIAGHTQLRCENVLAQPIERPSIETQKEVINYVSDHLNEEKIDKVISEFLNLYSSTIGSDLNRVMTEDQFSRLFTGLKLIADRYNIKIETKNDLVGVFPEGLKKIKISGFRGETLTPEKTASFLKRHELAHLFHVLALRVILMENSIELTRLNSDQIDKYIEAIEGGKNYLEFEKIVTDLSGAIHSINKSASLNVRYGQKLNVLFDGLKLALKAGKVKFPNGWSFIELYANFISKAPIVLGKSFVDMSARLSLMIFAEIYLLDENFRNFLWSALSR